jgi:hypothetical protein
MFSDLPPLTLLHVILSLIGIGSGFVVLLGLMNAKMLDAWTAVFLATTVATSATGFLLPAPHLLPSHVVGIISLVALALAITGRYPRHLAGRWRSTYVVTAVIAQYLNVFVLVVQLFRRVDALQALAPTQSEPPFAIAQLAVLLIFVALGILAVRGFRIESHGMAARPAH